MPTKNTLLGLDIGTTSTKAVLFDLSAVQADLANPLATAEQAYPLHTPRAGWVEQNPEDVWNAVVATIRAVITSADVHVLALSLAAQSGSLIPARSDGTPVYPIITWMDGRAEKLVQQWQAQGLADQVRRISGWRLHPGLPLPAIVWLRQFRPDVFAAAEHYFSVNDFLMYRLTGRFCTNPSNGGVTLLMDIASGQWSQELCALADITLGQLSPLRPSGAVIGKITPEANRLTGLPRETLVVNGGHDQGCTALGLGVSSPGKMLLASGTAWVITGVVATPDVAALPAVLSMNFHPLPGRWTASQSLGGLGAALEWLLKQCWSRADAQSHTISEWRAVTFASLDAELPPTTPGGGGLFFLPLTGGHQSPAGEQQGGFVGLRLDHTRADMARAVLEGAAFELRWALDHIRQAGIPVERLWMIGGAAQSLLWPSIVADVVGVPLVLPQPAHWPAVGAAILAGVGAGAFETLAAGTAHFQRPARYISPDGDRQRIYDECFVAYRRRL